MAIATFAAGCFWGIEAGFQNIEGVIDTSVGYIGGTTEDPTYKDVCHGDTNHAEAVQVEFDPEIVSFDALLAHFWNAHDPTQLNRQGPDFGTQYRSAIFYHDDAQRDAARASKVVLQETDVFAGEIVTEILPAPTFYRAEEYHQRYFERRGGGSCH